MRIALVTEFYYPHLGGVTEHVHHLALHLRALGHPTLVVASHMGGAPRDGSFVRRLGTSRVIFSNGSFARLTTGRALERRLEQLFREERIDLVHVHGGLAPTFGILAPRAAWRLGLPVVATFHSWFPRSLAYRLFRRPLQRHLDRHAAAIAVSEPVVSALSRYFSADWRVIPNGVDIDLFRPLGTRPAQASESGPRLLFLGRLDPRNGLETVLAAMPPILARYPKTRLVVAGNGPLRQLYERRAAPLGDRVEFAGQIYEDRPRYYGMADLYLCPTTKASFGVTLLEAMACGTPMIVSDITGFRELVGGGAHAVLAPRGDPLAWAAETLRLLQDPRRRAAMREAGLEKARRYAWSRVTQEVLQVYEGVLR